MKARKICISAIHKAGQKSTSIIKRWVLIIWIFFFKPWFSQSLQGILHCTHTRSWFYHIFTRNFHKKWYTCFSLRHFYHHLLVYTTAGTVSGKFMHTSRCRSIFDFHILLSGTAVQLLAGAIKVQIALPNMKLITGFPVKIWLLKWLKFSMWTQLLCMNQL